MGLSSRFRWAGYPAWLSCSQMWPGHSGNGRYWKRKLAKARRRQARAEIAGRRIRYKALADLEGRVNYKTW